MGKYIEKLRKEKGLTQKELAKQLGISNTAISKWECDCNLPDISMLGPLSNILDADIMVLLSYLNNNEKTEINSSDNKKDKSNKIKFIIIFLIIFVLIISIIFLTINLLLNKKETKELESNERRVYEITSEDERLGIKGYVIFNEHNSLILINKLNYQETARGTTNEIYINNIKININVGETTIYSYENMSSDDKKHKLSDVINDIEFENVNLYNTGADLINLENKFEDSILIINYSNNNEDYKKIEVKIYLNKKFTKENYIS